MKAASCSQRVGDIRPCAPGALQGPAQSQACCRSACGQGGGPSASSCFAEPVRTEAPGRPCPTLATPAGTRGPSGVSPGTSSVPAAPSTPPRWQSRPPAPSLTVHSGPATQQPRADVSWPQTAFSFWEAGETPGSQASSKSSHQSFWGEAGARPGLVGLQAHRASGWAVGTALSRHGWAEFLEAAFSLIGLEAPQGPPRLAPAWAVTARKRPCDRQEALLQASCCPLFTPEALMWGVGTGLRTRGLTGFPEAEGSLRP